MKFGIDKTIWAEHFFLPWFVYSFKKNSLKKVPRTKHLHILLTADRTLRLNICHTRTCTYFMQSYILRLTKILKLFPFKGSTLSVTKRKGLNKITIVYLIIRVWFTKTNVVKPSTVIFHSRSNGISENILNNFWRNFYGSSC